MCEYLVRWRGDRMLSIPVGDTLENQRRIFANHVRHIPPHNACHGFRQGRSCRTAAVPHEGARYIMHLDLSHFFASCSPDKVRAGLLKRHIPRSVIRDISQWCFFRGGLPQGSCTSPALANLAAFSVDELLSATGLTYTRYADNMLLSSEVAPDEGRIRELIRSFGWKLNERKCWLHVRGRHRMYSLGHPL